MGDGRRISFATPEPVRCWSEHCSAFSHVSLRSRGRRRRARWRSRHGAQTGSWTPCCRRADWSMPAACSQRLAPFTGGGAVVGRRSGLLLARRPVLVGFMRRARSAGRFSPPSRIPTAATTSAACSDDRSGRPHRPGARESRRQHRSRLESERELVRGSAGRFWPDGVCRGLVHRDQRPPAPVRRRAGRQDRPAERGGTPARTVCGDAGRVRVDRRTRAATSPKLAARRAATSARWTPRRGRRRTGTRARPGTSRATPG